MIITLIHNFLFIFLTFNTLASFITFLTSLSNWFFRNLTYWPSLFWIFFKFNMTAKDWSIKTGCKVWITISPLPVLIWIRDVLSHNSRFKWFIRLLIQMIWTFNLKIIHWNFIFVFSCCTIIFKRFFVILILTISTTSNFLK